MTKCWPIKYRTKFLGRDSFLGEKANGIKGSCPFSLFLLAPLSSPNLKQEQSARKSSNHLGNMKRKIKTKDDGTGEQLYHDSSRKPADPQLPETCYREK